MALAGPASVVFKAACFAHRPAPLRGFARHAPAHGCARACPHSGGRKTALAGRTRVVVRFTWFCPPALALAGLRAPRVSSRLRA
eukprot:13420527-Alexandrium_andersonii.AAC.1